MRFLCFLKLKSIQKSRSLTCFFLVRETGLEPVRCNHTPLKRARLPVPPLSHMKLLLLITTLIIILPFYALVNRFLQIFLFIFKCVASVKKSTKKSYKMCILHHIIIGNENPLPMIYIPRINTFRPFRRLPLQHLQQPLPRDPSYPQQQTLL